MNSSVSKSNSTPNHRILRTNILAGLLHHCITGSLELWRTWFVLSERNTRISVLSESCVPGSCCRNKTWILSKRNYPRTFKHYSCSLISCKNVNWLGCTYVVKPECPGLVNFKVIWSVRLLQIFNSWEVQTSTQPVQKTTDITESKLFPLNPSWRWDLRAKDCFNWKSAARYALKLLKSVGLMQHTHYPFDFSGSFSLSTLHFYGDKDCINLTHSG